MKTWILSALALCLVPLSAFAIEEVKKNNDGSISYRCEFGGTKHEVQVKYLGKGEYLVLRHGSAATGISGKVIAGAPVDAARMGCGE